jgi:hypothetical protein
VPRIDRPRVPPPPPASPRARRVTDARTATVAAAQSHGLPCPR